MSIILESLSAKDIAIVSIIAKEKTIQILQQKFISTLENKNSQIEQLNRKLQKKVYIEPEFATTKDAASFIGVDPSFLTKRQGDSFKLGEHFFKPEGESIVRWKLEALRQWLQAKSNKSEKISQKLAEQLERS